MSDDHIPSTPHAGLWWYRCTCTCGWRGPRKLNAEKAYQAGKQHKKENVDLSEESCDYHGPFQPCPRCGEPTCLTCENWQRYHSPRGWFDRRWWRYVAKWFVK